MNRIRAPYTDAPEAAVLRRHVTTGINGCEEQATYAGLGRQLFFVRPVRPLVGPASPLGKVKVILRILAANGKDLISEVDAMPVYFRMEDETGSVLKEDSLFLYGRRSQADIEVWVDASSSLPTWRFYSSTTYGPQIELRAGAEEFLLAVSRVSLDEIAAQVPIVPGAAFCRISATPPP